tara:strand:+ start:151 stop:492 length:342 start_codon:yes stop_codon:yes gene_type:complete
MLYAWDFGVAHQNQPWRIGMRELVPAIKFSELHIKSLISLSAQIADHPDARLRRSVLRAIEDHNGHASLGKILGSLKMKKRPVVEILDSLLEEGRVTKSRTDNGFAYILEQPY